MFEVAQTPSTGYKLIDKGSGLYQIRGPRGTFTGSLRQVCKYSVVALGFSLKEIEIGVIEMEKHFHNAAEYGIFKRFMWTEDLNENTTRH